MATPTPLSSPRDGVKCTRVRQTDTMTIVGALEKYFDPPKYKNVGQSKDSKKSHNSTKTNN